MTRSDDAMRFCKALFVEAYKHMTKSDLVAWCNQAVGVKQLQAATAAAAATPVPP
jgi:hypothetical protein